MREFGVGHNSGATEEGVLNRAAVNSLRDLISRIEDAEKQAKEVADYKKELYTEGKAAGFDVQIIRKVVALRKADLTKLSEQEALIDLYMAALIG